MKKIFSFLLVQFFLTSVVLDFSFSLAPSSNVENINKDTHASVNDKNLSYINSNEATSIKNSNRITTFRTSLSKQRHWIELSISIVAFSLFISCILMHFQVILTPIYATYLTLSLSILLYIGLFISLIQNRYSFIEKKDQYNPSYFKEDSKITKYSPLAIVLTIQAFLIFVGNWSVPFIALTNTFMFISLFSFLFLSISLILTSVFLMISINNNLSSSNEPSNNTIIQRIRTFIANIAKRKTNVRSPHFFRSKKMAFPSEQDNMSIEEKTADDFRKAGLEEKISQDLINIDPAFSPIEEAPPTETFKTSIDDPEPALNQIEVEPPTETFKTSIVDPESALTQSFQAKLKPLSFLNTLDPPSLADLLETKLPDTLTNPLTKRAHALTQKESQTKTKLIKSLEALDKNDEYVSPEYAEAIKGLSKSKGIDLNRLSAILGMISEGLSKVPESSIIDSSVNNLIDVLRDLEKLSKMIKLFYFQISLKEGSRIFTDQPLVSSISGVSARQETITQSLDYLNTLSESLRLSNKQQTELEKSISPLQTLNSYASKFDFSLKSYLTSIFINMKDIDEPSLNLDEPSLKKIGERWKDKVTFEEGGSISIKKEVSLADIKHELSQDTALYNILTRMKNHEQWDKIHRLILMHKITLQEYEEFEQAIDLPPSFLAHQENIFASLIDPYLISEASPMLEQLKSFERNGLSITDLMNPSTGSTSDASIVAPDYSLNDSLLTLLNKLKTFKTYNPEFQFLERALQNLSVFANNQVLFSESISSSPSLIYEATVDILNTLQVYASLPQATDLKAAAENTLSSLISFMISHHKQAFSKSRASIDQTLKTLTSSNLTKLSSAKILVSTIESSSTSFDFCLNTLKGPLAKSISSKKIKDFEDSLKKNQKTLDTFDSDLTAWESKLMELESEETHVLRLLKSKKKTTETEPLTIDKRLVNLTNSITQTSERLTKETDLVSSKMLLSDLQNQIKSVKRLSQERDSLVRRSQALLVAFQKSNSQLQAMETSLSKSSYIERSLGEILINPEEDTKEEALQGAQTSLFTKLSSRLRALTDSLRAVTASNRKSGKKSHSTLMQEWEDISSRRTSDTSTSMTYFELLEKQLKSSSLTEASKEESWIDLLNSALKALQEEKNSPAPANLVESFRKQLSGLRHRRLALQTNLKNAVNEVLTLMSEDNLTLRDIDFRLGRDFTLDSLITTFSTILSNYQPVDTNKALVKINNFVKVLEEIQILHLEIKHLQGIFDLKTSLKHKKITVFSRLILMLKNFIFSRQKTPRSLTFYAPKYREMTPSQLREYFIKEIEALKNLNKISLSKKEQSEISKYRSKLEKIMGLLEQFEKDLAASKTEVQMDIRTDSTEEESLSDILLNAKKQFDKNSSLPMSDSDQIQSTEITTTTPLLENSKKLVSSINAAYLLWQKTPSLHYLKMRPLINPPHSILIDKMTSFFRKERMNMEDFFKNNGETTFADKDSFSSSNQYTLRILKGKSDDSEKEFRTDLANLYTSLQAFKGTAIPFMGSLTHEITSLSKTQEDFVNRLTELSSDSFYEKMFGLLEKVEFYTSLPRAQDIKENISTLLLSFFKHYIYKNKVYCLQSNLSITQFLSEAQSELKNRATVEIENTLSHLKKSLNNFHSINDTLNKKISPRALALAKRRSFSAFTRKTSKSIVNLETHLESLKPDWENFQRISSGLASDMKDSLENQQTETLSSSEEYATALKSLQNIDDTSTLNKNILNAHKTIDALSKLLEIVESLESGNRSANKAELDAIHRPTKPTASYKKQLEILTNLLKDLAKKREAFLDKLDITLATFKEAHTAATHIGFIFRTDKSLETSLTKIIQSNQFSTSIDQEKVSQIQRLNALSKNEKTRTMA
ncbi:hypothetical protein AB834_01140 [PVC group bacterium (ex Bugula neritina AB1)]|nr:hypothetical protein AB834_01140 [PVC group bacterium (ex Bugula neritina AB1)]